MLLSLAVSCGVDSEHGGRDRSAQCITPDFVRTVTFWFALLRRLIRVSSKTPIVVNLMFVGPCIIVITEE